MKFSIIDPLIHFYHRWINGQDVNKASLRHRFIKGSFWSFSGTVISRGLGLIAAIIIARILGRIGYGEYGIIISTVGMFSAVGNLGLGLTATRYIATLRNSDPKEAGVVAGLTMTLAIISYGICSLVLFIFAPVLAAKTLNAPHLSNILRIVSIMLLLGGIDGVQLGILAGFEAFRAIARVTVIRGIINLIISSAGVWFFGLQGAVIALVIISAVSIWINAKSIKIISLDAKVLIGYGLKRSHLKLLLKFSLPTFLVGILSVPISWMVNAILVNTPNGYAEMGLLSAVIQWRAVAIILPSVVSTTSVTLQSNLIGNRQHSSYRSIMKYNLIIQIGGTALVILSIIVLAPWIMHFYGESFLSGKSVLMLMAGGWFFMTIGSVFWDAMVASGNVWAGFIFNLLGALVLLISSLFLVGLGARGIAISYIFSYITIALCQVVYFIFTQRIVLPKNSLTIAS